MSDVDAARQFIREFKGDRYAFGSGALRKVGALAAQLGRRAVLIHGTSEASQRAAQVVEASLREAGVSLLGKAPGARPNAPREDVFRMAEDLRRMEPDVVVAIGGGSTLDAAKAAIVLKDLGEPIDQYFGVGLVTTALQEQGRTLTPLVAVQMAASSGAHLTKYSNITDLATAQKKLIVDEAIVPPRAAFQYDVTVSMSPRFTADGAMDGLSHLVEVLYGLVGQEAYERAEAVALVGTRLLVGHVERAVRDPHDLEAREALGLGTDLGAYAIMIGGTSGGHLTSFSLVDILPHGRACALMNPYYTVFFAPAIQRPLRALGQVFRGADLTQAPVERLAGRDLGLAVAEAMLELLRRVGLPTTLREVEGFTEGHIQRALQAAKDPQLEMKLRNMPVPLTPDMVDDYMGPILEAARDGDLHRIRNAP
ncbi:MAG: iron-containing alcohol dehydrogenase [Anaerolineae bacterium]|nr:iron-containing alcohol dehydrogenase [Anaerolineae bacterium]